ncbi:uncharacterized protein LOC103507947 [Diaphorina citri]|uniref:Uncharacterized protein LOC103507947 n=1 Tax=Diaphorina citri TaxID=121845 RepID=A0A3Q0IQA3_DIACI|nr:uncharacterized protein LOC103507947 [Diaphorina citri]
MVSLNAKQKSQNMNKTYLTLIPLNISLVLSFSLLCLLSINSVASKLSNGLDDRHHPNLNLSHFIHEPKELLDEEFLDYLARKFDRYFRTRNLKIQIAESVKKIDREVFGGILPTAESGRRGTATHRKKSKIPLSFIITIAAALGLILLKILAAKTILLSKLALLLAGLQFFKSGHGGSSKYTGSTTTLSDGGKSNIEIATAKRRNSECAANAALVTHYNEGVRSVAANEAAGAATIGLGDSILVGQPMSGHVNYDYNRRNVLQRADYFDPYVQEDPKLFVPNDFYQNIKAVAPNGYYRNGPKDEYVAQYIANDALPNAIVLNEYVKNDHNEYGKSDQVNNREEFRRRMDKEGDKRDKEMNRMDQGMDKMEHGMDKMHHGMDKMHHGMNKMHHLMNEVDHRMDKEVYNTDKGIHKIDKEDLEDTGETENDPRKKIPRLDHKNDIDNTVDSLRENYHPIWKTLEER